MRKTKKDLDVDRFRKLHDTLGSPEGANARDLMVKMCEECGISFLEASALANGQGVDTAELDGVIQEQQAKIEMLQSENQGLADGYRTLEAKLQGKPEKGEGFSGFIRQAWALAKFRMLLLCLLVAGRMLLFVLCDTPNPDDFTTDMNWVFGTIGLFLMIVWIGRQYEELGVGSVFTRLFLFCGTSTLASACLFEFRNWRQWYSVASGAGAYQAGAFVCILIGLICGASNFPDCLCHQAETSDVRLFEWMRTWIIGETHD